MTRTILRLSRPLHLLLAALTYLLGAGIARYLGIRINGSAFWLGLVWVMLIQIAAYLLAEYFRRPFEPLGEADAPAQRLRLRTLLLQISAAALTLAQNLKKVSNHGRLILVMGVMADKDVDTILARLLPLAQMVIFTQPQYFRAATPRDLARRAQPYGLEILQTPRVAAAVQQAQSLAGPDDHIVITGSLYTVGEAKEYFMDQ